MKKKGISLYITVLTVVLSNLVFCTPLSAQEKKLAITETEEEAPFYQGTTIGLDVFGLGSKVFGGDITSTEVGVEVNLLNRFFPVLEVGYGSTDATHDETNIHYKTSAPYFRLGMNYNFFYKKTHLPGFLYGGLRYGFSSFKYDVEAPTMSNPAWPKPEVPFSYQGVKTNVSWAEFLVGIKVNVYQNLHMGWSVRYRMRLSQKKAENSEPWYIPGYGKNGSSRLGITYSIIYQLPF